MGVCRQLGDLERARLFCYGLLKEGARGGGALASEPGACSYIRSHVRLGFQPSCSVCLACIALVFGGGVGVTGACLSRHARPCCVWEGLSPLRPGVTPWAAALDSDVVGTGGGNRCDAAHCAVSLAGRSGNCAEFIGSRDVSGRRGRECCPWDLSFERCVLSLRMGADGPHSQHQVVREAFKWQRDTQTQLNIVPESELDCRGG